ncbi:hypothetical protein PAXRUDRAFT_35549 [Paxillus rubicundulus Ve08.2h10]|uniref:Uncharacterized protein n=1 Tax=Paxillus rubicundulus Ve08.2h10 TaxID=930991 RepID=A0A0D0DRU7_9AGAM|nr:hypothetical protein PAXRUDRAFT_35549 [Paxillus rubicundulus Ve08.2h10]
MFPTYDPENSAYFDQFSNSSTFSFGSSLIGAIHQTYFAPFLNATTFHLMNWFYNSSSPKSLGDLDWLVNNVILANDFDQDDLHTFSVVHEAKWLDSAHKSDRWHETSIHITLNCKSKPMEEAAAPKFTVEGPHYRKSTEVAANTFHMPPFKLFWQPDEDKPPEHIITELYTLDAMLQEHENIKGSHQESGCNLETIVATIMLWSDSTHLANFGNSALWPIYMFIGNQSKYTRSKLSLSLFATHHLAYIPKIPTFGRDMI